MARIVRKDHEDTRGNQLEDLPLMASPFVLTAAAYFAEDMTQVASVIAEDVDEETTYLV